METMLSDTGIVISETVHAYTHVDRWAKDVKPSTSFTYQPMNLRIKPSPKGAVLIISPFNFPVLLTFTPLVGALAAGCTVVLKLPESLATTSPLLGELVAKYLDPDVVQVVHGAVRETSKASFQFA
jgi:aldehyde dehydrogenase (NAD+)